MREVSQMPMTVDLEPVQLVAADGTPTLSWLYEMMVVTRELDTEFVNLKRQGELALFASCRGQEAAQVGAAACLRKTDWLFPQYRELGAYLVRGIPPGHVAAAWRGTWHGGLEFTTKCCAPITPTMAAGVERRVWTQRDVAALLD
jgi:2-oxoisovalerate dehydrogenase E1 component alpha subunit